jgi:hypothetical protein
MRKRSRGRRRCETRRRRRRRRAEMTRRRRNGHCTEQRDGFSVPTTIIEQSRAALLVSSPFFKNYLMYLCTTPREGYPLPWKYISTILYKFFYGKPSLARPAPKPNPKWECLLN